MRGGARQEQPAGDKTAGDNSEVRTKRKRNGTTRRRATKNSSSRESGDTIAEIAEETGRRCTTITGWLRRFEKEGKDGMPQRSRSGRPPRTSAEHDAAMVKMTSRHPLMPLEHVAAAAGVDNIHVSVFYTPEES